MTDDIKKRPIESAWEEFFARCCAPDTDANQRRMMRSIFYAGAMALDARANAAVDAGEHEQFWKALDAEFDAWQVETSEMAALMQPMGSA